MNFVTTGLAEKQLTEDRSTILIANFDSGFALGWKMAVPNVFRKSLDIRFLSRVYDGVAQEVWTQGTYFDFKEGDTVYDSQKAYNSINWGESLKHLKISVQVLYGQSVSYSVGSPILEILQDTVQVTDYREKKKNRTFTDGLKICKFQRNPGKVRFQVLRPSQDSSGLERKEIYNTTQDEFVCFLQTGKIRPFKAGSDTKLSSQLIDLLSEDVNSKLITV